MGKHRRKNKHLPARVYEKHNAFYYVTRQNKWIRLGSTFPEAMANWANLVDKVTEFKTMNDVIEKYMGEVAPLKAQASYKSNITQIKPLKLVFGEMKPCDITPVDIYQYMDLRTRS